MAVYLGENKVDSTGGGGGTVDSTSIPTASKVSEFDSEAKMNSIDMTPAQITTFVNNITPAGGSLLDIFYPVGSYYETSDSTFNPNVQWGGTWVLENEGQVHVSAGENYEVGDTGGEVNHLLTIDELPPHNHRVSSGWQSASGQPDRITYGAVNGQYQNTGNGNISFVENTGGNVAHNNMQPYIVVNRWHRTA